MNQEVPAPDTSHMNPPPTAPEPNHGRTVAGWFLTCVVSIGVLTMAVGAVMYNWAVIWTGAGLAVLGVVVSVALRLMGYGQPHSKADAATIEDL